MRPDWKRFSLMIVLFYTLAISGCAQINRVRTHQEIEELTSTCKPLPDSLFTFPDNSNVIFGLAEHTEAEVCDYSIYADGEVNLSCFGGQCGSIYLDDDRMHEIRDLLLALNNRGLLSLSCNKVNELIFIERTVCCLSLLSYGEWISARSLRSQMPEYWIVLETKHLDWRIHFNAYHMKHMPLLKECHEIILDFFYDKFLGPYN